MKKTIHKKNYRQKNYTQRRLYIKGTAKHKFKTCSIERGLYGRETKD